MITPPVIVVLFSRRVLRMSVGIGSALFLLAWALGLSRFFPLLASPHATLGLVWRFCSDLALIALDSALVGALPIAFGSAYARMCERGEVAALTGLGSSPARLAGAGLPAALALGLAITGIGVAADPPERLAAETLHAARASCAPRQTAVAVPGTRLVWLCGDPPDLVGPVSGTSSEGPWMAARRVASTPDGLELHDVVMVDRSGSVSVRVDTFRYTAAPPPTSLPPWAFGGLAAASGLGLAYVLVAHGCRSASWGWAIGAVLGVVLLLGRRLGARAELSGLAGSLSLALAVVAVLALARWALRFAKPRPAARG